MRSTVAVVKTFPERVLEDIARAMELAGFEEALPKEKATILKINISWHFWYPACSTTPWQLDGVTRALRRAGYEKLFAAQNRTVVIDPERGALRNHLISPARAHSLPFVYLYKRGVKWVKVRPKAKMRVLSRVFEKEGILIPKCFIGKNAVHLPTLKTHVFTGMTGAMKNAFGGLLRDNRHYTHSVIHETLVDLLAIQREIHPGLFAVMDGTFAGEGAGPRAMEPRLVNTLLASADPVALDAVAAYLMGFDPLKLKFLRLAHEDGLGCADLKEMDIVGDGIEKRYHFKVGETFASRGQKLIYHGALKPLEHLLLRSWIAPWSYIASRLYYDFFWYPLYGHARVKKMLHTPWGRLFQQYGD